MRKFVLAIALMGLAATAFAGNIYEIQTGVYAPLDEVTATGTVTGVRNNGFFMQEAAVGYSGIWVYTGTGNHTAIVGDDVEVKGLYKEYYDLSEIDVAADATGYVTIAGNSGALPAVPLTAAQYAADPEPWEGMFIMITDGLAVVEAPNTYGEWVMESLESPGTTVRCDDYWYDDTTVVLGQCSQYAAGCLTYSFGNYLLEVLVDGLMVADCAVDSDAVSFGAVKSLYR